MPRWVLGCSECNQALRIRSSRQTRNGGHMIVFSARKPNLNSHRAAYVCDVPTGRRLRFCNTISFFTVASANSFRETGRYSVPLLDRSNR
jgi:hypothetical protein